MVVKVVAANVLVLMLYTAVWLNAADASKEPLGASDKPLNACVFVMLLLPCNVAARVMSPAPEATCAAVARYI